MRGRGKREERTDGIFFLLYFPVSVFQRQSMYWDSSIQQIMECMEWPLSSRVLPAHLLIEDAPVQLPGRDRREPSTQL